MPSVFYEAISTPFWLIHTLGNTDIDFTLRQTRYCDIHSS